MAISSSIIGNTLGNPYYDANRDMYISREEAQYMMQMQEEEYRRMQAMQAMQDPRQVYVKPIPGTFADETLAPAKDPLAFLKKADNKLLLTGEMQ